MNDSTLHEITNQLNQIIGNTALLQKNPDRSKEYAELIEQNVYRVDAMIRDLFHDKPSYSSEKESDNKTLLVKNMIGDKKVLIIDDLEENRNILNHIFSTLGSTTECVESGEKAIELFEEYKPDIVCMDIVMPNMHGDEATHHLKNLGCTAKFIAVSALKEYNDKSINLFDAWLPKPFTINQLSEVFISLYADSDTYCPYIINSDNNESISDLSEENKQQILDAIKRGALSELEYILSTMDNIESAKFLQNLVAKMEFEKITSLILSA